MGEVWKGRDPRLNRDVAIKVSAQQFTDRFEREARAIAALNHKNICTLYDIGPNYLVMEFVEGPTLAERISPGPIPLEEALGIAKQIADALEAAHEKPIVHRDLKPANIKVKPDGTVKVLDFGLAKSAEYAEVTSDSPTMLSIPGMILGTAGYMAPEQARGKDVDKRADIWAFGVVLYEMLMGKRLFGGETVSDTLAAVIKEEPDLTKVPAKVQRLLRRCLEKDPKKRLRDISGAELLLEDVASAAITRSSRLPWAVAAVSIVAALGLGIVAWRHYSEEPQLLRMSLQTPEKAELSSQNDIPMISPDGRRVAFAARVGGKIGLWLRDLDLLSTRQLPGTDGAGHPFWSPDSRWVAFFAGGKLKKIDVTGGPAMTLCDVPSGGRGGAWNREDLIVYAINQGGLFRVPAAGGTPTPLSELDRAASEVNHRLPWFLPDGRHFLYTSRNSDPQKTRIYVDSIDANPGSKTRREVLAAHSNAVYVPLVHGNLAGSNRGYLLFMRESTLMAQPFDASNARTTGNAVPVAEQVDTWSPSRRANSPRRRTGILAYTSGIPGRWLLSFR
jgi:serine/threonine protein kinase